MRRLAWKRSTLAVFASLVVVAGLFVVLVGPWPTYDRGFEGEEYYENALAAIAERARASNLTDAPGRLQAGWGRCPITPPIGTPLAGYSARKGAPSTGVHDDLYVKAVALSDGIDRVALVGSDLLLVPENVAEKVRENIAARTPLTGNDVLFTASHTHSGPGAFAKGLGMSISGGRYDAAIATLLEKAFAAAIAEAFADLEPARLASGGEDIPEYIRNRVRPDAPVDSELCYLVLEQDDGDQCFVVSYSAHPTVFGADNLAFSAEYPGFLMRTIEEKTGAMAVFLGGAVGSMGPKAPGKGDDSARSEAMGKALAERLLQNAQTWVFHDALDVASVGVSFTLPPIQLRLNQRWRVSPFLPRFLGVDRDAWLQSVRVGHVLLIGTPCDFSGEISVKLKAWTDQRGFDLWVLSFNGDYVGYVSPDYCYNDVEPDGSLGYETGVISLCGPHQEAYFTSLITHMVNAITPESPN